MTNDKKSKAPDLRQQAERIVKMRLRERKANLTEADTLKLIHELEVHQIELEMQMGELNRSYNELELSEVRYAELYDLAPIGYFTINEKDRFTEVNLKAADMMGMTRGELVNQEITRFILIDDLNDFHDHQRQLFEKKIPSVFDLRMRTAKGNIFWARMHTALVSYSDGDAYCFVAMSDITQHKMVSQRLKESEEQLNLFFSQSLDGFFFMMLDEPVTWNDGANKEKILDYAMMQMKIVKINQAMLDQYGAEEPQLLGMTPAGFFSHDMEQGRKIIRQIFDNGHLLTETREQKLDGTDMVSEGNYICTYDTENRITGHFGIQRDITGRKQDELKITKQLEELQQWQVVTLGREDRTRELKQEVNQLLQRLGEPVRYPSQATN